MTAQALPFDAPAPAPPRLRLSMRERLRAYFRAHPNEWVSLPTLMAVAGGGSAAVTAKLRDLRKPAYGGMRIDNQAVRGEFGCRTVSEYRWVP